MSVHECQGSWQQDRCEAAFGQSYINVDELSFADLMVMGRKIAEQLHYYSLDNEASGNWAKLFGDNEVLVMALLLHQNTSQVKLAFDTIGPHNAQAQWDFVIQQYTRFNDYFVALKYSVNDSGTLLAKAMALQIKTRLAHKLKTITSTSYGQGTQQNNGFEPFDAIWEIEELLASSQTSTQTSNQTASQTTNYSTTYSTTQGPPAAEQQKAPLKGLLPGALYSLMHVLEGLKVDIAHFLKASLACGQHQSAIGLFMTFLRLFEQAQRRINRFNQRHFDFYFADVLHSEPKPASPDGATVAFTLEAGQSKPLRVAQGAELTCGKNKQADDIVFNTEQDVWVSDAQITQVKTLHMQRDPRILPECLLQAVNRIKCNQLAAQGIPLFGADKPDAAHSSGIIGETGFAISSPMLNLGEGERTVEVSVVLSEPPQVYAHIKPASNQAQINCIDIFSAYLPLYCDEILEPDSINEQSKSIFQILFDNKYLDDTTATNLALKHVEQPGVLHRLFLLGHLAQTNDERTRFRLLQEIFCRYLLCSSDWLNQAEQRLLVLQVVKLQHQNDQVASLAQLLQMPKAQLFDRFVSSMFKLLVTTKSGWQQVSWFAIGRLPANHLSSNHLSSNKLASKDIGQYGFKLKFSLSPGFAPVVPVDTKLHGKRWLDCGMAAQPILQFATGDKARFFGYSLFQSLNVERIDIDCQVKGLTKLLVYNDKGQVDPSVPFMPFGAQPGRDSYLLFGGLEMAQKPISALKVNLSWADLPIKGGFSEYYKHYSHNGKPIDNHSFSVDLLRLTEGNWQQTDTQSTLFSSQDGALESKVSLTFKINKPLFPEGLQNQQQTKAAEFTYTPTRHDGFYKMSLSKSSALFGQQEYPGLLSSMMMTNSHEMMLQAQQAAANPKDPIPAPIDSAANIPNLPYVPLLSGLTLDYSSSASFSMVPGAKLDDSEANYVAGQFIQISPFGLTLMDPRHAHKRKGGLTTLLPRYDYDGNLLIGIRASQLPAQLSLFFDIGNDAVLVDEPGVTRICWQFLSAIGWQKLQAKQLVGDTTFGLLQAGIVTFALGEHILRENAPNQDKIFWLCASANNHLEKYGTLNSITPHAVTVIAQNPQEQTPPNPQKWTPVASIAGITEIKGLMSATGGLDEETRQQWLVRMSERLAHKQRAQTPKDYELLILQQFPEVARAKCFSHAKWLQQTPAPGHVLIIVQSKTAISDELSAPPLISSCVLNDIRRFVQKLTPAFVQVDVRNPYFEKIQVNCALTFNVDCQGQKGTLLDKLNEDVSRLLYPYDRKNPLSGFGWQLSLEKMVNLIGAFDYVQGIGELSLLRIYQQHQNLPSDQQNQNRDGASDVPYFCRTNLTQKRSDDGAVQWLKPQYPWSLPIAVKQHIFHITNKTLPECDVAIGINRLEIGNTFIINRR